MPAKVTWCAGAAYVPLLRQDPADWDADLLAEGEAHLRRARTAAAPGRFALEAAIGAVHADRRRTGMVDLPALRTLYDALVLVSPTLGARVARASIVGRIDGPEAELALLDQLGTDPPAHAFQPWHAARADALARAGRTEEATAAYLRAADLSDDDGVIAFLRARASGS